MAKGKYEEWLQPDNLLLLEGWKRNGLTDEQIAKNMGINVATLYTWRNKYDKINNALKKGKEVVDLEVENALYKSAVGYSVPVAITERNSARFRVSCLSSASMMASSLSLLSRRICLAFS